MLIPFVSLLAFVCVMGSYGKGCTLRLECPFVPVRSFIPSCVYAASNQALYFSFQVIGIGQVYEA